VAERRGPEPLRAHDRAAADIFSAADTDRPTGTTNANGSSPGDHGAVRDRRERKSKRDDETEPTAG
jgi:hypothetical protein